jgi:hypothetical protein
VASAPKRTVTEGSAAALRTQSESRPAPASRKMVVPGPIVAAPSSSSYQISISCGVPDSRPCVVT